MSGSRELTLDEVVRSVRSRGRAYRELVELRGKAALLDALELDLSSHAGCWGSPNFARMPPELALVSRITELSERVKSLEAARSNDRDPEPQP